MNDKTVGMVLLVSAGACCTLGMVGAKIAYAIERGSGSAKIPELGWEIWVVVVVQAFLGLTLLFAPGRPES